MKFVYLIMSGEGNGKVVGVCSTETTATNLVHTKARVVHNINPNKELPDFDGTLARYGWADLIWWQKEVLYD